MATVCCLDDCGSNRSEQDFFFFFLKSMKWCQFEGGGLPTVHVQQGGSNQKVSGWIS